MPLNSFLLLQLQAPQLAKHCSILVVPQMLAPLIRLAMSPDLRTYLRHQAPQPRKLFVNFERWFPSTDDRRWGVS
jgi:hypothetical protein